MGNEQAENVMHRETLAEATPSDAALVTSILAGEPQAFERLMRRHNRRLFRVARSILRDDAEAEDALQEGYILAYKALPGFRGDARLSTWLTRIIVNQALERKRRRPAAALAEADPDGVDDIATPLPDTPESRAMRGELRRMIEASVDALPDTYRSVFVLRAVEGLSVEETAISLGISEASVKTRFLRGRAKLRQALGLRLGPLVEDLFSFAGARCDRIVAGVCARLGLPAPSLPHAGEILVP